MTELRERNKTKNTFIRQDFVPWGLSRSLVIFLFSVSSASSLSRPGASLSFSPGAAVCAVRVPPHRARIDRHDSAPLGGMAGGEKGRKSTKDWRGRDLPARGVGLSWFFSCFQCLTCPFLSGIILCPYHIFFMAKHLPLSLSIAAEAILLLLGLKNSCGIR